MVCVMVYSSCPFAGAGVLFKALHIVLKMNFNMASATMYIDVNVAAVWDPDGPARIELLQHKHTLQGRCQKPNPFCYTILCLLISND
jgi:hypothetical protein